MQELKKSEYERVEPLFAALAAFNLSVATVIQRNSPGRIWVDDVGSPRVGFLLSPEGEYLAGWDSDARIDAALKETIPFGAYLIAHPDRWERKLGAIWCNRFARKHLRRHYVFREMRMPDWRERIPDGFSLTRIDGEFLQRRALKNFPQVAEWIEDSWDGDKGFLERGLGFCMVRGETVVNWCLTDCVSGKQCEIGIDSDAGYRRRGLAALTVAATVDHCLARGLTGIGWHCLDTNAGSYRTAEKAGFALERRYCAYSSGYPAENPTDLNREEWLEWADYYEKAAQTERIFRYGEVECRAQAGEGERALRILRRMMAEEWQVPLGWLQGHWTFAALRETDAWRRLIARLEKAGKEG